MICFPNCKINLGLYITRKRDDGYHDLETVFYPIKTGLLNDALEIVPSKDGAQLHMSGLPVTGNIEDNLVWKAYKLLQAAYPGKVPPLDIFLHKALPMGAGMGGGSADGAFMLRLINDYCGLGLTDEQLARHALQLGSDCPFFIYNTPQFATGRGEVMHPITVDLSCYSIQLICPEVHVSTRDAFANISPRPAPFGLLDIGSMHVEEWKHHVSNDFEQTVFSKHPALAAIKQQLYEQGAVYASMSGSGSAMYGLFPKGKKATILAGVPFKEYFI
jgi:4-diphosphocytidyl-2-C-methyl-D-erythritol kinase